MKIQFVLSKDVTEMYQQLVNSPEHYGASPRMLLSRLIYAEAKRLRDGVDSVDNNGALAVQLSPRPVDQKAARVLEIKREISALEEAEFDKNLDRLLKD